MTNRTTWAPFPDDPDAPRYASPLYPGDSYHVRTNDGRELWANFEHASFVPCDNDGAPNGEPVLVAAVETTVRA